jgi:hypothetical protein
MQRKLADFFSTIPLCTLKVIVTFSVNSLAHYAIFSCMF